MVNRSAGDIDAGSAPKNLSGIDDARISLHRGKSVSAPKSRPRRNADESSVQNFKKDFSRRAELL
jgi:hypothetical protein